MYIYSGSYKITRFVSDVYFIFYCIFYCEMNLTFFKSLNIYDVVKNDAITKYQRIFFKKV